MAGMFSYTKAAMERAMKVQEVIVGGDGETNGGEHPCLHNSSNIAIGSNTVSDKLANKPSQLVQNRVFNSHA
jgi:hypothetical protein